MINLKKSSVISFTLAILIMGAFLIIKLLVLSTCIQPTNFTRWSELAGFLLFIPLFSIPIKDYLNKNKESVKLNYYAKKLNETLITQSHNPLFYEGNVTEGAKELTKEVIKSLKIDRCSIWLYNEDETSIICEQLYLKKEDEWVQDLEIFEKDYKEYFEAIKINPNIVADDVFTHPATACFTETYSIPLGVKSMLDVPIVYKGKVIGVICNESFTPKVWHKVEINFAEMLSSLYSFAYSVWENKMTESKLSDFELFVDKTALITKADKNGKITYANQKFLDICGWTLDEVIGSDHNIVNSGVHSKQFWRNMINKVTVKNKEIWHEIVTNKTKEGKLYYVDTYVKAEFDPETNALTGFVSIRQDVTELYESLNEVSKKNTYLEHAAKILRHDMHSGINTYIPRGISSLERRLKKEDIERLKLESPLKLLKEGLKHTQKVYKGVYEFTNLVKKDAVMDKSLLNLKIILSDYLKSTAYSSQVAIDSLPDVEVNESLFCTAIDNLIRNGLRYNDSENRLVKIFMENEDYLVVQDNGRGMTQEEFNDLSQPYIRKESQKESGSGLGLNICIAILKEHNFRITCEKNKIGTKLKIKIK
jgi:PAS domain S-box-containing protein